MRKTFRIVRVTNDITSKSRMVKVDPFKGSLAVRPLARVLLRQKEQTAVECLRNGVGPKHIHIGEYNTLFVAARALIRWCSTVVHDDPINTRSCRSLAVQLNDYMCGSNSEIRLSGNVIKTEAVDKFPISSVIRQEILWRKSVNDKYFFGLCQCESNCKMNINLVSARLMGTKLISPSCAKNNMSKYTRVKRQKGRILLWLRYFGLQSFGECAAGCGTLMPLASRWEAGHVEAKAFGGKPDINNLRPICSECNLLQGTTNMRDFSENEMDYVLKEHKMNEETADLLYDALLKNYSSNMCHEIEKICF